MYCYALAVTVLVSTADYASWRFGALSYSYTYLLIYLLTYWNPSLAGFHRCHTQFRVQSLKVVLYSPSVVGPTLERTITFYYMYITLSVNNTCLLIESADSAACNNSFSLVTT